MYFACVVILSDRSSEWTAARSNHAKSRYYELQNLIGRKSSEELDSFVLKFAHRSDRNTNYKTIIQQKKGETAWHICRPLFAIYGCRYKCWMYIYLLRLQYIRNCRVGDNIFLFTLYVCVSRVFLSLFLNVLSGYESHLRNDASRESYSISKMSPSFAVWRCGPPSPMPNQFSHISRVSFENALNIIPWHSKIAMHTSKSDDACTHWRIPRPATRNANL